MANNRRWYAVRALESAALLAATIDQLSEKEVLHCLSLEAASRRRKTLLTALIRRAARFNKARYINYLKEKYNVPYLIEDSEQR